jgi:glycosyltransferase involved in cell wall biosynthesis
MGTESWVRPKVSVVMSVYNCVQYINEALNSLLKQNFSDFEIIIIDDASDDGTLEEVLKYKDARIRLFKNDIRIGLTKNLNKGLGLARGEYIARFDGDDIVSLDRLGKQCSYLDRHSEVVAVGSCAETINNRGDYTGEIVLAQRPEELALRFLLGNSLIHPATMFRKSEVDLPREWKETCESSGQAFVFTSSFCKYQFF